MYHVGLLSVCSKSQLKETASYCRFPCHIAAMTSSHVVAPVAKSVVLYGCIEKNALDDEMQREGLIPVDRRGAYVGLRTDILSAYERMKQLMPELQKSDVLVFSVEFTPQGYLYCMTHTMGTFQRMVYPSSAIDWRVHHFNGPIPFHMQEAGSGE